MPDKRKVSSSSLLKLSSLVFFITMIAKKKNIVRKIKNFTINFGPQHPAAHGVLRRAGRTHCKVFHPQQIDWHYSFSPFLGSLLRICLVMLRCKKHYQFCFKLTMGVGVKKLSRALKTSVKNPPAPTSVVSGLPWVSIFLSSSSLILSQ